MGIRFSHVLAIGIAAGIAGWMATGAVVVGGRSDDPKAPVNLAWSLKIGDAVIGWQQTGAPAPVEAAAPPAARNERESETPFRVRVRNSAAAPRQAFLEVRGRTEAEAKVEVRAETSGRVARRPVTEGETVAAGTLLCELDAGARQAKILETKAQLAQASLDFDAATQLNTKGFAAQTRVAALKAAEDAARARLEEAELELSRTRVLAPISGRIESPMAEVGTMLAIGQVCATLIDANPMLAIGQISEQHVRKVELGQAAQVRLVTGNVVEGKIRYIAPAADAATRTFRVEIEIPNPDGIILDGITALTRIPLAEERAHRVSSSVLTLNDKGTVGVRTVDEAGVVSFRPVEILGGDGDGVWLAGLPDEIRLIVVGQDYVVEGQKVEPVLETAEVAQ